MHVSQPSFDTGAAAPKKGATSEAPAPHEAWTVAVKDTAPRDTLLADGGNGRQGPARQKPPEPERTAPPTRTVPKAPKPEVTVNPLCTTNEPTVVAEPKTGSTAKIGPTFLDTAKSVAGAGAIAVSLLKKAADTLDPFSTPPVKQPYQLGNLPLTTPALLERKPVQLPIPIIPSPLPKVAPMLGPVMVQVKGFDTSAHAGLITKPVGGEGFGPFGLLPVAGATSVPVGLNIPSGFVQAGYGKDSDGKTTYLLAYTYSRPFADILNQNCGSQGQFAKSSANLGFQAEYHLGDAPGGGKKIDKVVLTGSVGAFGQAGIDLSAQAQKNFVAGNAVYVSGSVNYLTVTITQAPRPPKSNSKPVPVPVPIPIVPPRFTLPELPELPLPLPFDD